jgi:hypothetical protein
MSNLHGTRAYNGKMSSSGGNVMAAIEQEIIEQIRRLNPEQQKQVLNFVRELSYEKGETGREFIERTKGINFPKEDLEEIARIIEEDEERIDWDDWNNPLVL